MIVFKCLGVPKNIYIKNNQYYIKKENILSGGYDE